MDKNRDVKFLDTVGLIFSFLMIGLYFCFYEMFAECFDELKFMFSVTSYWWTDTTMSIASALTVALLVLLLLLSLYMAVDLVNIVQWFRKKDEDNLLMVYPVTLWMKHFPQKRYIRRIDEETIGEKYKKQKLERLFNEHRKLNLFFNFAGTFVLFALITCCVFGISVVVTYNFGNKLKNNEITWLGIAWTAVIPLAVSLFYYIMYDVRIQNVRRKISEFWMTSTELFRKKKYRKILSVLRKCGVLHIIVLLITSILLLGYMNADVFSYKLRDLDTGEIIETGSVTVEDFIRRINSTTNEESLRIIAESGAGDEGALCAALSIIGLSLFCWVFLLVVVSIRKIFGKGGGSTAITAGIVLMGVHFVCGMILFLKIIAENNLFGSFSRHGNIEATFSTGLILPFVAGVVLCVIYYFLHSRKIKRFLKEI